MRSAKITCVVCCFVASVFGDIIGTVDTSGKSLFATGGDVTAYFIGQSASYTDFLTLASPTNGLGTIFINHTATPESHSHSGAIFHQTVPPFEAAAWPIPATFTMQSGGNVGDSG